MYLFYIDSIKLQKVIVNKINLETEICIYIVDSIYGFKHFTNN